MQSYVQSDQTWLLDSLNWDKVSVISTLDLLPLTFINNLSFLSQHVITDYTAQSAYLENSLLLAHMSTSPVSSLYVSHTGDLSHIALVYTLPAVSLFFSSFYNVSQSAALLAPELALVLTDYLVAYETSQSFNMRTSVCFDSGVNTLNCFGGEGSLPLIMFGLFAWFVVYMVLTDVALPWSRYNHSQFARSYVYLFSFSKETRVQLEVVLQTTVLFLFY